MDYLTRYQAAPIRADAAIPAGDPAAGASPYQHSVARGGSGSGTHVPRRQGRETRAISDHRVPPPWEPSRRDHVGTGSPGPPTRTTDQRARAGHNRRKLEPLAMEATTTATGSQP